KFRVEPTTVADVVAGNERPMSDLILISALPERYDLITHLVAQDEGQLRHPAIATGANQGVEVVDADSSRLDQHFAPAGHRSRHIYIREHFGAADVSDLDAFHRILLVRVLAIPIRLGMTTRKRSASAMIVSVRRNHTRQTSER